MRITKNFSLSLAIVATTLGLLAALAPLAGRAQSDPVPAIEGPAVSVETVVSGLEHPWGMAFLPNDAGILITERPGTLRVWTKENGLSAPISGVPKVHAQGQGGCWMSPWHQIFFVAVAFIWPTPSVATNSTQPPPWVLGSCLPT